MNFWLWCDLCDCTFRVQWRRIALSYWIFTRGEEELDLWQQFRTSSQDSHHQTSRHVFRILRIQKITAILASVVRSPRNYFAVCPAMSIVLHLGSIPVIHSSTLLRAPASSARLPHAIRFHFVRLQNVFVSTFTAPRSLDVLPLCLWHDFCEISRAYEQSVQISSLYAKPVGPSRSFLACIPAKKSVVIDFDSASATLNKMMKCVAGILQSSILLPEVEPLTVSAHKTPSETEFAVCSSSKTSCESLDVFAKSHVGHEPSRTSSLMTNVTSYANSIMHRHRTAIERGSCYSLELKSASSFPPAIVTIDVDVSLLPDITTAVNWLMIIQLKMPTTLPTETDRLGKWQFFTYSVDKWYDIWKLDMKSFVELQIWRVPVRCSSQQPHHVPVSDLSCGFRLLQMWITSVSLFTHLLEVARGVLHRFEHAWKQRHCPTMKTFKSISDAALVKDTKNVSGVSAEMSSQSFRFRTA